MNRPAETTPGRPHRQLTLLDTTCIIMGIVIGSGIYQTTPFIASLVPNLNWLMAVWVLGGLISFVGALCYAELVSTYPEEGGDYVFLTKAFGRNVGFVFAWSELWIVRPGSIGAMAFVFASYANRLFPLSFHEYGPLVYAVLAIVLTTGASLLGVSLGKWVQNTLTLTKVLGLIAIFVTAMLFAEGAAPDAAPNAEGDDVVAAAADANAEDKTQEDSGNDFSMLPLALILVLYTYGGWNEMAYVGAELRDPEKNVLRSLLVGTLAVTAMYVAVNGAFVYTLGMDGVRQSQAVAADTLEQVFRDFGGKAISLLICISALGSINGQIFTGSRIYYAVGRQYPIFSLLGRWNARFDTPAVSLFFQAVVTLGLVAIIGLLRADSGDPFERLVIFTTPAFWTFLGLVGVSLFVLRRRNPDAKTAYRAHGYPFTPLLFCSVCAYVTYSGVKYAISQPEYHEAFWSLAVLGVGIVMSFLVSHRTVEQQQAEETGK